VVILFIRQFNVPIPNGTLYPMPTLLKLQLLGERSYLKIATENDWLWRPTFLNLQSGE